MPHWISYFPPADAEFPRHRTRYVQRVGASSLSLRIPPHALPASRKALEKEETIFDLPLLRARYTHGCISCVLWQRLRPFTTPLEIVDVLVEQTDLRSGPNHSLLEIGRMGAVIISWSMVPLNAPLLPFRF